jgi:hypothetical protein
MSSALRVVLLALPFLAIVWVHWVGSLQATAAPKRFDATQTLVSARRRASQPVAAVPYEAAARVAAAQPTALASPPPPPPPSPPPPAAGGCPAGRKPYHTLLTATGQVYQQWQCRIMYYHWKKQRDADPAGKCTELTGFTRLVASNGGRPDGLEKEIPSYFATEYNGAELSRFHGYRVINRPYSVVQYLKSAAWRAVAEEYVYIAETDHVMMHPLPNKAAEGSPMAYIFGYMGPNPAHAKIIQKAWPDGGGEGWKKVQSIGPSPVVIHKRDLEKVSKLWHETAVALKTDAAADSRLGWVIEMWGYAIAAAAVGLRHQEFRDFQVEPGALSTASQLRDFESRYWVFHYTYQFEYMLDGTPCQPWTIGEFSLDKRHFSDQYPTPPLPLPPPKSNVAAFWLTNAFNEAMAAIPEWPRRQPPPGGAERPIMTLYGRRRLDWFSRHANGFATELRTNALVKKLADTTWECVSAADKTSAKLGLTAGGDVSHLDFRRLGRWGSMNDPALGEACAVHACIFLDSGAPKYNARVAGGDGDAPLSALVIFDAGHLGQKYAEPTPRWECKFAKKAEKSWF